MSTSRRRFANADELLEEWAALTAQARRPTTMHQAALRRLGWLAPAVAAVLLVAVLGVLVLAGPLNVGPTPVPSLSATPLPSASTSPTPSPTASETPPATPPPSQGTTAPWSDLGYAGSDWALWSPDSQKLLIHTGNANSPTTDQVVTLLDPNGQRVLGTYHGDQAIWVDANSFLLYAWTRNADGTVKGLFWEVQPDLVTIGSGARTRLAIPSNAISNGRGAVAYQTSQNQSGDGQFAVWTSKSTSRTLAGTPLAWSADGSRLAIWHFAEPAPHTTGGRPSGWLDVLALPDLSRLYANQSIRTDTTVAFDPTGRYLLYGIGTGTLAVADTTTQSLVQLAGQNVGAAWDEQSHVISSSESYVATIYDSSGKEFGTINDVGDRVTSTADGSVIAFYYNGANEPTNTTRLTVLRAGSTSVFVLPGADRFPVQEVAISPDGSRIVAITETDQGESVLLLALK